MADNPGNAETVKDFGSDPSSVPGRWLAEINAYERTFKDWMACAERANKRYRNTSGGVADNNDFLVSPAKFNIFWSNVQTLQPALYSRTPQADITRVHKDKNPAARASAIILERATRQELKHGGFDDAMRAARDDYLIAARGQVWVRYVPTYGEETRDRIFLQSAEGDFGQTGYTMPDGSPAADDIEPLFDDDNQAYIEDGEPYKPVAEECVKVDHVQWKDFGHTPAPQWKKVTAVWKAEMMTRSQLVERFGEKKGRAVALDHKTHNVSEEAMQAWGDVFGRAKVYEIWDKETRKVIWIADGHKDEALDEADDPLKLQDFFPCPKPLYGTTTTDSLVPVPDYDEYRAQAEEIDLLTERIRILTKALKVAGAYAGDETSRLQQIFTAPDNILVPVDNWAMFAEKGGVSGLISWLPIAEVASAIDALSRIRDQSKRDLFEVTGISDIVRGQGQASETATAQSIKGQFAGMRLEDRQANMGRFARDTVQIVAEIIAEHFSPETLWDISGWEYTAEARALDKAIAEKQKQIMAAATGQPNGQTVMPMGNQAPPDQTMGAMTQPSPPPQIPQMPTGGLPIR